MRDHIVIADDISVIVSHKIRKKYYSTLTETRLLPFHVWVHTHACTETHTHTTSLMLPTLIPSPPYYSCSKLILFLKSHPTHFREEEERTKERGGFF